MAFFLKLLDRLTKENNRIDTSNMSKPKPFNFDSYKK